MSDEDDFPQVETGGVHGNAPKGNEKYKWYGIILGVVVVAVIAIVVMRGKRVECTHDHDDLVHVRDGPDSFERVYSLAGQTDVQVKRGPNTYRGEYMGENGQAVSFMGIPYAEPPVGDLRWKDPKYIKDLPEGFVQKKNLACAQHIFAELWDEKGFKYPRKVGEDCLYLNIHRPTTVKSTRGPLPVMFYIHGGSFETGSGTEPKLYWAYRWAAREEVVVVTINYRLGIFGQFRMGTDAQGVVGNQGMKDQRAALQWVQDNIKAFGGDPTKVTLFGNSAGAYSILAHMNSKLSAGLFRYAIPQSANLMKMMDAKKLQDMTDCAVQMACKESKYTVELPEDIKEPSKSQAALECMQNVAVDKLLDAQRICKLWVFDKTVGYPSKDFDRVSRFGKWNAMDAAVPYYPYVDGEDWTETHIMTQLIEGRNNAEAVLLGNTKDESWGMMANLPYSNSTDSSGLMYTALAMAFWGELGSKVIKQYPTNPDLLSALAPAASDSIFKCGAKRLAAEMKSRNYYYQFEHYNKFKSFSTDDKHCERKACHADELEPLFGTLHMSDRAFNGDEQLMSLEMQTLWTTFAKTGIPKTLYTSGVGSHYSVEKPNVFHINNSYITLGEYADPNCGLWNGRGGYDAMYYPPKSAKGQGRAAQTAGVAMGEAGRAATIQAIQALSEGM